METINSFSSTPKAIGLYDPAYEHDACGVAMVATLKKLPNHEIVSKALTALRNLEHRGASGAEPDSGDGAGILIQVPDKFYRSVVDFKLPDFGSYATGIFFVQPNTLDYQAKISKIASEEGIKILGWRDLPIDSKSIGKTALSVMPEFKQLFIAGAKGEKDLSLERLAFCLRKRVEHSLPIYISSLSSRTIVYKGMLTTGQLEEFFPDLSNPIVESPFALVHSRFSTNTFPSWPLAHPYRYIAHNGEINTVKGNRNWMRARETLLESDLIPGDLKRLFPIVNDSGSDSASFDEVLELLYLGGRSLPHSVLMMIPEAWENHATMPQIRKDFYAFHSALMEPWDGPACVTFTDGHQIGAVLDRNGLRPSRFWVTDDGLVVLASEVGVLDFKPESVVRKGRLQPGKMFLVDIDQGRIIEDDEIKQTLASAQPYGEWLSSGLVRLSDLPAREHIVYPHSSVVRRQRAFGYTEEEIRLIITPMARNGAEPLGSMGTDTPIAALSEKPRLLFDYFAQLFAQVTNPPLDAIREELVTSLGGSIGPEHNLLDPGANSCRQISLQFPVIDNDELAKIINVNADGDQPGFVCHVVKGLFPIAGGGQGLAARIKEIRTEVSKAIEEGARIIVLSDRDGDAENAPIPSLLLTSAVHHHLIREKTRTKVGLVVESGEVREVHHVALLIGFGTAAVNPYLAMETAEDLVRQGVITGLTPEKAVRNLIKSLGKGVLKVMSKMGVSTIASYTGAQIFEAIGLSKEVVDEYFVGLTSRLGGVGIEILASETIKRHHIAYPPGGEIPGSKKLQIGGEYQWRREGEPHLFDPETVFTLQHATRTKRFDVFKRYTARVDDQSRRLMTLRGLFSFKTEMRKPIPIEEVEQASEILKRFATGAMSYGSISQEAHETLAIAMNRIGGKSNTGEGGEDPARNIADNNGDLRRSAIKQVASGRFGVTSEYLVNADDIQIKMAQGAKPGEGGQLPGNKVYPWIAKVRYSTPGVGLISPPPHHDIYSIEDLAQLIHDLKNANNQARIHVKLVAEVGVGTVAAGVSKAHADVVLISGHDGGTGASPLTSLKHAGAPWELGLAETQQTLMLNGLRDRIVVQVDGQMKTGRDVVIAALLGAEEFGFATAPLVVSGCVMMRVCHLDTCPVGVATQNPELRKKFTGKPEFVETFFEYIAEEVRQLLADLGFKKLEEAIGQVELLDTREAFEHWKAKGLDLSPILVAPSHNSPRKNVIKQDHGLATALDNELIRLSKDALVEGKSVMLQMPVRNVNRTVGTMLGSEITRKYGGQGLPTDTIDITFHGSAGQSFGAFIPSGLTLRLYGDSNDYVAKGLSGGRVIIRPDEKAKFNSNNNVIAGNVIGYGATSGEIMISGVVGERFCVRNSGATAVVEGVGDHGCEYMTGGVVIVLGSTGRNFAAGMSGGMAFILDIDPALVNTEMVDLLALPINQEQFVKSEVSKFFTETGSKVAGELLNDWDKSKNRITQVMPRDYARVLDLMAKAQREGLPEEDAVMAVING
ncbi:glutamate synthase (NADPH/NADH) large chain [Candidatus Nanopelagicus hibericus]|uniref:Glutamate synthase (NADPH/NADH) large chain n=1 Tax=Candidatus Nanopelagicus hibericus TaxID=1884915 RepID=A0A249K9K0_9ACTN|nr:glutamate synthase large subunit [Candidatus Nanopelagicus hibericus]ASY13409.1 glutamate synthase (NADPH/NADH) large chain [Candidatus Nanopelagicus hibericus]